MGIAWFGRFAIYFEEIAAELGRKCGLSYADFREAGLRAPIAEYHVDYVRPLVLDEEFTISASLIWNEGARLNTEYELTKADGTLAARGYTVQVFSRRRERPGVPRDAADAGTLPGALEDRRVQGPAVMKAVVVEQDLVTAWGVGASACWRGILSGKPAFSPVERFNTQAFQAHYRGAGIRLGRRRGRFVGDANAEGRSWRLLPADCRMEHW